LRGSQEPGPTTPAFGRSRSGTFVPYLIATDVTIVPDSGIQLDGSPHQALFPQVEPSIPAPQCHQQGGALTRQITGLQEEGEAEHTRTNDAREAERMSAGVAGFPKGEGS